MSKIFFSLNTGFNLYEMVPDVGKKARNPLPQTGGIYLIFNSEQNNRYIGIAKNFHSRFQKRMETVTELGLSQKEMTNIWVWIGTVDWENSSNGMTQEAEFKAGGYGGNVDNKGFIDFEHVLIRYFLAHAGFGGTISNNQKKAKLKNQTMNDIKLDLQFANIIGPNNTSMLGGNGDMDWKKGKDL